MNRLISHETAKLAKEAGFNYFCRFVWNKDGTTEELSFYGGDGSGGKVCNGMLPIVNNTADCVRPTQTALHSWILKKHIVISVYNNASGFLWNMAYHPGGSELMDSDYAGPNDSGCWDTWEGALENALQVALKAITLRICIAFRDTLEVMVKSQTLIEQDELRRTNTSRSEDGNEG